VDHPTIHIGPATATDMPALRELLQEYVAWVDHDLSFQDFQSELRNFPGDYTPPRGALLAASVSGRVSAMIALRPLDETTCEMKRLFVSPAARGLGLGRALVLRILDEARRLGYRAIRLDTLPQMGDAQALYAGLGFRDIEPYYDTPIQGTRFMEMDL
jgi:ribosomal protein S18 acetylase RimI-like enzyme